MRPCSGHCWSLFVDAEIPITVILLTLGELGTVASSSGSSYGAPASETLTPSAVAQIRQVEFERAMVELGADYQILGFGDFALSTMPFRNLALPLLNVLRSQDLAAVFSFHPFEITPGFDHPDHNLAGEATRFAASGQDITNLKVGPLPDGQPAAPVTTTRPELYFWTTDENKATHRLKLGQKSARRRRDYLSKNYPSQFPSRTKRRWGTIFDRLGNQEYYQRVR